MKKKTMKAIFVILFIIGVVVGYLLPGDIRALTASPIKTAIHDVPKRFGQLDLETPYFKYAVLATTETGSIELLRVDLSVPKHLHPKENHFAYIHKGRAKFTINEQISEVGQGQLVVIPAGAPHSVERIGDTPLELILFSSPPRGPEGTVFLER